jgi:choline dehydrogenase-like flavoprotein
MAATNGVNGVNGTNGHLPAHVTAQEFSQHEFDYLICGGGTAGLCIAARLTENPDVTVGVIEAGKNKLGDMLVDTPAMFIQMLGNPEYDWNYKTVPQPHNKDTVHHIPRGKLVGGSSGWFSMLPKENV